MPQAGIFTFMKDEPVYLLSRRLERVCMVRCSIYKAILQVIPKRLLKLLLRSR